MESRPDLPLYEATDQVNEAIINVGIAFQKVGTDIFQALQEEAYEIGGDGLLAEVVQVAFDGYDVLPDPMSIELLIKHNPGGAKEIIKRTIEIQQRRHQEELDAQFPVQSRLKKFGKGIIGASTLILTGRLPR